MGEWVIRLAYGIMIVGIMLCFVFSRNHQRDLRKAANAFAFAFVKLSNYISPKPPKAGLLTEELPGGKLRALPAGQQPEAIRNILERANSPKAVELFAQLDDAADTVSKRAGFNRTHKAQFQAPLDELLLLAHTFLVGCENLESIDTPEKKAAFDSFLMEQPQHRMVLIKRITGDASDEYRELNKRYAKEMERIEEEEWQAKRKAKGKKPDASGKAAKAEPKTESKAEPKPEIPAEQPVSAEKAGAEKAPKEESSLRDEWSGWGCG